MLFRKLERAVVSLPSQSEAVSLTAYVACKSQRVHEPGASPAGYIGAVHWDREAWIGPIERGLTPTRDVGERCDTPPGRSGAPIEEPRSGWAKAIGGLPRGGLGQSAALGLRSRWDRGHLGAGFRGCRGAQPPATG